MSQSAREMLEGAKGSPLTVKPGENGRPRYKEAYGNAFWTLMEEIADQRDMMHAQLVAIQETLKLAVNQGQLGLHAIKNLESSLLTMSQKMKSLPAPESDSRSADDTDLKGE